MKYQTVGFMVQVVPGEYAKCLTINGWLLERSAPNHDGFRCWISDPDRHVVGYGRADHPDDAVRRALADAGPHYLADPDELAALEYAYFGPKGRLTYRARPVEVLIGDNRGIVVQILGRIHVMESIFAAARAARPKNFRRIPPALRRGWAKCVIDTHLANRATYCAVMGGRL